jgi:hypothetical protein
MARVTDSLPQGPIAPLVRKASCKLPEKLSAGANSSKNPRHVSSPLASSEWIRERPQTAPGFAMRQWGKVEIDDHGAL